MCPLYAIRNDDVNFQYLDLNIMDVLRNAPDDIPMDNILDFHLHNTAMLKWWKIPVANFKANDAYPATRIPDISVWPIGSLVLSPKAYRLLKDSLEPFGEFLPVMVSADKFYIFNCLTLGEEASAEFEYHEGMKMEIKSLTFKNSVLEKMIFKSKEENCLTLYCGDRFRNAAESFGLSGISFDENLIG